MPELLRVGLSCFCVSFLSPLIQSSLSVSFSFVLSVFPSFPFSQIELQHSGTKLSSCSIPSNCVAGCFALRRPRHSQSWKQGRILGCHGIRCVTGWFPQTGKNYLDMEASCNSSLVSSCFHAVWKYLTFTFFIVLMSKIGICRRNS